MDQNEQSAGFSGVVPNLISVVPENTLNIFPLPLVCLVFVLGHTVVLFWRMPETTGSSSVLSQSQTGNSGGEFLHHSHPFAQGRAWTSLALKQQEEEQKSNGGRTKGSGEGPPHSPSSEQAGSPTL